MEESPVDVLIRKSAQLTALCQSFVGDGFETFRLMNEQIQHDLLFLALDLAQEIQKETSKLSVEAGSSAA